MTGKKRQHFVPRFYLRRFSNQPDRKSIGVWNVLNGLVVRNASLRDQACADHFYGKDTTFEDALAQIEDGASQILQEVAVTEQVPGHHSVVRDPLIIYILFQSERTRYAAEALNESIDKLVHTVFKEDKRVKDSLPTATVGMENASVFLLRLASRILPVVTDLEMKLLRNSTKHEFITSDNPVVKYNQFLESRGWPGGHTGWAIIGLQVFFPISPTLCLVLYDQDVYRVGHRHEYVIDIEETHDVDQMNALQYLNADENTYFTSSVSGDYIQRLCQQYHSKRRTSRMLVKEFHGSDSTSPRRRSLIACSPCDIKLGLSLSFIQQTRKAKSRQVGPSMANPRNPRMLAEVEQALEKDDL